MTQQSVEETKLLLPVHHMIHDGAVLRLHSFEAFMSGDS
jgi:hypothetical protein